MRELHAPLGNAAPAGTTGGDVHVLIGIEVHGSPPGEARQTRRIPRMRHPAPSGITVGKRSVVGLPSGTESEHGMEATTWLSYTRVKAWR